MDIQFNSSCTYGIIGAGNVGLSLAIALEKRNELDWIIARSENSKDRADNIIKDRNKIISSIYDIKKIPDYILIAVDNKNIQIVSDKFAEIYGVALKGKFIVHFSGSLSRNILDACKDKGALTFAAHPYQTFYLASDSLLENIPWGIEPSDSIEKIINFVNNLKGIPKILSDETVKLKPVYHLSAVAVSNFLNTVIGFGKEMALRAGIVPDDFFPEIIKTTIENNLGQAHKDNNFPLTGPVARGDLEAIKKHIELLAYNPQLQRIYKLLTCATAKYGLLKKIHNEVSLKSIIEYLED